MTFKERYKKGETTSVYSDIEKLGPAAFSQKHFVDIEAVLTETMERTAYNLAVIYDELQRMNYNFRQKIKYSFEAPLKKPLVNTDELLTKLEDAVKPFGAVPLSLKLFYKIVGSCNFAWDYETDANILWEGADPIQIAPLDVAFLIIVPALQASHVYTMVTRDAVPVSDVSARCAYAFGKCWT